MAIVGTAVIRVKLLSSKVGNDIKKSVNDSLKDVGKDINTASEKVGKDAGKSIAKGMDKAAPEIQKSGDTLGKRFSTAFGKAMSKRQNSFRGIWRGLLFASLLTVGPAIIAGGLQILAALGGALVALGSTFGAAFAGAAIAGFAAFAAVRTTMALIKLALKEDTEALKEFNTNVKGLKSELAGAVQVGLLPGLDQAVGNLRGALPALRKNLVATGKTVGDLANNFTKALTTGQNLKLVNKVLANNNTFIKLAGEGFTSIAQAALIFLSHLGPITDFLGKLLKDIGAWLLLTTQTASANGTLATKINEWFTLARRAFGILVDFGKGIFNIFKGASDVGGDFFTVIEGAAQKFSEWSSSVEGQSAIKQFFDDIKPLASEVFGLFKDIVKFLGANAIGDTEGTTGFVKMLREDVLPALISVFDLLKNNSDTIGSALGVLKDIATSDVGSKFLLIAGGLLAVNKAFGGFPMAVARGAGAAVGGLGAKGIGKGISALGGALKTGVQKLGGKFLGKGIAGQIGDGLADAGQSAIDSAMGGIDCGAICACIAGGCKDAAGGADIVEGLKDQAVGKAEEAGDAVGEKISGGIMAKLKDIGSKFVPVLKKIGVALLAIIGNIPVVGWIILAIVAVVALFVFLLVKFKGFRDFFINIWKSIVDFFKGVWEAVVPIVMTVFNVVKKIVVTYVKIWIAIFTTIFNVIKKVVEVVIAVLTPVVNFIAGIVKVIVKIFQIGFKIIEIVVKVLIVIFLAAFSVIAQIVIPIVLKIWKFIVTAFTTVWKFIKFVFNAIWDTIKFVFGFIYASIVFWITLVWNIIKTVFTAVWNFIKGVFTGIWNTIKTVFQLIWSAISTPVNKIWNFIKSVFSNIKNFIGNIWQGIVRTVSGAARGLWDTVKTWFDKIVGFVQGIMDKVKKIITGVWDGITGALKSAINFVIRGINGIITIVNSIIDKVKGMPLVGKIASGLSHISPLTELAEGGVVSPTPGGVPAVLAEAGRKERVEPLDDEGMSKRDRAIIKALGGGGATTVNVFIGQEKLEAIVETKIEENNDNLAQQIVTGRR